MFGRDNNLKKKQTRLIYLHHCYFLATKECLVEFANADVDIIRLLHGNQCKQPTSILLRFHHANLAVDYLAHRTVSRQSDHNVVVCIYCIHAHTHTDVSDKNYDALSVSLQGTETVQVTPLRRTLASSP